MTEPIDVCGAKEIDDEDSRLVPATVTGSVPIALFRDGDEIFALSDRCTHGNASLAEGWIEDGTVECPAHASAFCLRNGKVLNLPATEDAPTHKVEVVDGRVLLYPGVPAV